MPSPPRRWFAFRLRTLLFVVVPLCAILSWVGYQLNWIRQRHEARGRVFIPDGAWQPAVQPPPSLRIFGERGAAEVLLLRDDDAGNQRLLRLFPEAGVNWLEPAIEQP